MRTLIVIPARYASTRFPGKPLAMLKGVTGQARSLIERTWAVAQQVQSADSVIIATDDDRIRDACHDFGANVVMTSSDCANGTERCAEVVEKLSEDYDLVINLQGDAPLTPPGFLETLINAMKSKPDIDVATPVLRCNGRALANFREDRKNGRVGGTTAVFDNESRALYFSKELLPFTAKVYEPDDTTPVFHHMGVYAYRPAVLRAYKRLKPGILETLEGLEQLRFLESGCSILCVEMPAMSHPFWELNNPGDIERIESILSETGIR